ncbi:transposable element Tcb1 transposase [Trichonephila clavipes]|nr:transposable element Tcb1 transposase [Trichonephila clavipes]
MLGRRIASRQPPPTSLPELRRALLDEWCNIPQDQIDNLILSMPRRYKFDDDMQKVTPARAPLSFSLFAFSLSPILMSKSFSLDLLRLRAKTALLLAACHNGQPDCPLSAAVRIPFFLSMDTRGESEAYKKKTEQTRTVRQIHKGLKYHNSAELNSFSIM